MASCSILVFNLFLIFIGGCRCSTPWSAKYKYPETKYFDQKLDHFNPTIDDTFKERYMISTEFWDPDGGPIFFYTGNEGDITLFVNNTGFMWDIAPKFRAMVVFAEHRFYGKSKPYPDLKPTPDNVHKFGQFTVEQALADFAKLIVHLKSTVKGAEHSPVIAFGGSYGGMLAAWLRQKYPHVINGALAASAPVRYFPGMIKCDSYYKIITRDFESTEDGKACVGNIRRSWSAIDKISKSPGGFQKLTKQFRLCNPLKKVEKLTDWIQEAWSSTAMVDYPYSTNFLNPLPAWPVDEICRRLAKPNLEGDDLLAAIHNAAGVFYNYTGKHECFSLGSEASPGLSTYLWGFQTCTEMVMPFCTTGVTDMFKPSNWTIEKFTSKCLKKYGTKPRPTWPALQFGSYDLTAASNIIFSNGELDPWSAGGVLESDNDELTIIKMENSAHHLDLRHSNILDPNSVIIARMMEIEQISVWIEDALLDYDRD